jgi:SpoVK/Ycf46/Vps4 family AAA+-type ATPase
MVSICWAFVNAKNELQKAYIEELVDDTIYDEAYPSLDEGVSKFISNYLSSDESILVLQGKPGTGKTRLIRSILGAMTLKKNGKASALYTGDKKTMENDEIFVSFVTGDEDTFVIEDADYILKPRADGNDNLHRFLTIADGVVRSQGRKIIFSTNLPNIGDLDDALIRPGRCFARLVVREHSKAEACKLLERLCDGDSQMANQILEGMASPNSKGHSLAEIYRAFGQVKQLAFSELQSCIESKQELHELT